MQENKKKYLLESGYSKDLVDFVLKTKSDKYLVYIVKCLHKHKNEFLNDGLTEELFNKIVLLNSYLEKTKASITDEKFISFFKGIQIEYKKIKEIKSKSLYKFKDGYFILNLFDQPNLLEEKEQMSNCIDTYLSKIRNKEVVVLALKDEMCKSIVHFEVYKNGSIKQIFEKANLPLKSNHWSYIVEFFNNNHKKINFQSILTHGFDFYWSTNMFEGGCDISCVLPKSVQTELTTDGLVRKFTSGVEISKFSISTHNKELKKSYLNVEKNKLINDLTIFGENINKKIKQLTKIISSTNPEQLYLSDEMKKKLFGDDFLLKGDTFEISELLNKKTKLHNDETYGLDEIKEPAYVGIEHDESGFSTGSFKLKLDFVDNDLPF